MKKKSEMRAGVNLKEGKDGQHDLYLTFFRMLRTREPRQERERKPEKVRFVLPEHVHAFVGLRE